MSAVSSNVLKSEYMAAALKLDKMENDLLPADQKQFVLQLEKGEGTLQIEKVGGAVVKKEQLPDEPMSVDISVVKTEPEEGAPTSASSTANRSRSTTPALVPSPAVTPKLESVADAADKAEVPAVEAEGEESEAPADHKTSDHESANEAKDSPDHVETENQTTVS